MRRMSHEITLSIVNYRRQKGGAAPKRILLNGRGSLLRGLAEYLGTTQKVPVEFFNPLQHATLASHITTDLDVLSLQTSEIIGEACRDMVPDGAGVNLLPDEIQKKMAFAAKKPFLLVAAACMALAPWPVAHLSQLSSRAYQQQEQSLQVDFAPLQSIQAQINTNAKQAEELGNSIQRVEGLVASK